MQKLTKGLPVPHSTFENVVELCTISEKKRAQNTSSMYFSSTTSVSSIDIMTSTDFADSSCIQLRTEFIAPLKKIITSFNFSGAVGAHNQISMD
jgi:hypothetical protein